MQTGPEISGFDVSVWCVCALLFAGIAPSGEDRSGFEVCGSEWCVGTLGGKTGPLFWTLAIFVRGQTQNKRGFVDFRKVYRRKDSRRIKWPRNCFARQQATRPPPSSAHSHTLEGHCSRQMQSNVVASRRRTQSSYLNPVLSRGQVVAHHRSV